MQEMYKEKIPSLPFKQMDVRSLQYDDGTFDAVIDKGTLDSILCGDGSGPNAEMMMEQIYRVLSPKGVYICITYGLPDQRTAHFTRPEFNWQLSTHKVAKPTVSTTAILA
jgi:ubiquinone/menaquinone biosynthesis C-methylase UbiE